MDNDKKPAAPENRSIFIDGDVTGENVIIGDNNSINQTIIQKFFNIFKSDSETLEHRNRRILLGHVENAWIKGVLDASLHGAALLDLGIKQDPEAVTKYPWAIKKESTDETLPAGTSMLEIFDSIGMGRSLLILGAPGSGKTTMLLELARQLIAHAREDVTYPIPMVFNLASWTEKLSLADWLAQELNNLYSVPRKTVPDWVQGNKLLLLLDGLDEVRQESRAKCVEAINAFRKEHGLTSLAVCSRSQDYADLNAKLSFEGAIEVLPLTQKQITEFFNRFGKEMAGIKHVLKEDNALYEMAETPLFLSIMIMAYRDKRDVDIWVSQDEKAQRKYLFDAYIERMLESPRLNYLAFKKLDVLRWLSWLASKMIEYNEASYFLENMRTGWIRKESQLKQYNRLLFILLIKMSDLGISTVDSIQFDWRAAKIGLLIGLSFGLLVGILAGFFLGLHAGFLIWLSVGLPAGLFFALIGGVRAQKVDRKMYPGQRLTLTAKNFFATTLVFGSSAGLLFGLLFIGFGRPDKGLLMGLLLGLTFGGFMYGGTDLIYHYILRFILVHERLLPWKLVPFLDHCVDLIFLRRVGGGYIFIHRLLMEHFAKMYVETPTSKGN